MHVEEPVQKMSEALNRPLNANGWSCSFEQWHPRPLVFDRLSNSYRLWR